MQKMFCAFEFNPKEPQQNYVLLDIFPLPQAMPQKYGLARTEK